MKAKTLIVAAALAVCSALAFGMAKNQSKAHVQGVVEYYGNAPFPRLGLKADDGTLYYLDAEKSVQDKIGALSGNVVSVEGTLLQEPAPVEMPDAAVLKVKSWKKR